MDLTAYERRIAELASEGLADREIAAQIFISSATVEYDLGKVYRSRASTPAADSRRPSSPSTLKSPDSGKIASTSSWKREHDRPSP